MDKRKNTSEISGLYKPAKSFLALVIVLGLISGVFFRWMYDYRPWTTAHETDLNGMNSGSETVNPVPTSTPAVNTSGLTTNQLLQRILDSVSARLTTQEAYSSIPAAQLGGLTFEEYQRYISLIDLALINMPRSFSPMTVSERDRQIARIVQVDQDYREIAEASSYHWLEATAGNSIESLAIAIQRDASGLVYLDRNWVRNIIDLYDYAQTYFGTIRQENAEVLSAMIYSDSLSAEVKLNKARAVLDYYDVYKVANQGLKIEAFDISRIRYSVTTNYVSSDAAAAEVPEVSLLNRAAIADAAEDGLIEPSMTRTLQLIRDSDGVFSISDDIPTITSEEDFSLEVRADSILKLNTELVSSDVDLLLGPPLDFRTVDVTIAASETNDGDRSGPIVPAGSNESEADEERSYLFVMYDGIEILIENPVIINDGAAAKGTLVGYTFTADKFKTLRGLSTSSSMDEALLLYPFIDQTAYVQQNQQLASYIAFPSANGLDSTADPLEAIRVGRNEELGLGLYKDGSVFGLGDALPKVINPKAGFSWKGINGEGDTSSVLPVMDRPMVE